jgi:hypothetical protein
MAKRNDENLADVAAQVRRHLESLRLAGVEWLPANAPLPPPADAPEPMLVEAPAAAPRGLFEEPIGPAVAAPPVSAEDRRRELKLLAERVGGCTRCKELA